jgi:hypothetical protein
MQPMHRHLLRHLVAAAPPGHTFAPKGRALALRNPFTLSRPVRLGDRRDLVAMRVRTLCAPLALTEGDA